MATKRDRLIASDREIKLFVSTLKGFLSSRLRKVLGQLESGNLDGAQAAQVLGSLQTTLKEMGLDKQLDEINKIYGKDLSAIVDRFAELSAKSKVAIITDVNRPMIETLIKGGFNQGAQITEKFIGDVRQQVALSILSGQPVNVDDVLNNEGEKFAGKIQTELATTFAAFHRTVTLTTAEDLGFTLFEYIGPDDQITREFCYKLLERDPAIYSRDEIAGMDNGQGLPVSQFGGGYNCRHIWGPVSEEEARTLGWKPR